eukprot:scaffold28019_cov132-Isochrysis_galbana.AAC.2
MATTQRSPTCMRTDSPASRLGCKDGATAHLRAAGARDARRAQGICGPRAAAHCQSIECGTVNSRGGSEKSSTVYLPSEARRHLAPYSVGPSLRFPSATTALCMGAAIAEAMWCECECLSCACLYRLHVNAPFGVTLPQLLP